PGYQIKKWDETNTPFDKLPFLKPLYKQKKWSFITDYMRLYTIYTEGGIYLDTDIEMLKSFDSLLHEKAFLGFQLKDIEAKYPLNSAVIGAEKGSKFILDCLKETERKQRLSFNSMGGPPIVSKILRDYGLDQYRTQHLKDVNILETDYFYPFSWLEEFSPDCITKNTICIHWWEDSWTTKEKGAHYYINSFTRKIQKLPQLLADMMVYYFNQKKFYKVTPLNPLIKD